MMMSLAMSSPTQSEYRFNDEHVKGKLQLNFEGDIFENKWMKGGWMDGQYLKIKKSIKITIYFAFIIYFQVK